MKEEMTAIKLPFPEHLECVAESLRLDIEEHTALKLYCEKRGKTGSAEEYAGWVDNQKKVLEYILKHPDYPTP